MELSRRSLPAQEALLFANANIESAHITQDRKQALEHCKIAEEELEKFKDTVGSTHLDQVIAAYRELGGLLEKLGSSDKAVRIHITADNFEQKSPGTPTPAQIVFVAQPSPPSSTTDTPSRASMPVPPVALIADQPPLSSQSTDAPDRSNSPVPPGVHSTEQSAPLFPSGNIITTYGPGLIPASIFAKDFSPQLFKGMLPKPDEALTDTRQLAYCLALLQASPSPDDSIDEAARTWLRDTKANEDEQDRLKTVATDVFLEFMRDGLKDEKATAEIACIAPVLESSDFRSLLGAFVTSLRDSPLLSTHAVQGLNRIIQCAAPGSMEPGDLIKILEHFQSWLQSTHTHSLDHVYRLMGTVSHILDAMVDGGIEDLDPKNLYHPLLLLLSDVQKELEKSTDPYLVFQAAYAFQALQQVHNDEKPGKTASRPTETVETGTARLFSEVEEFNADISIDTAKGGVEVADNILGRAEDAYRNISALKGSGQDLREALKTSFSRKHAWYPMLRSIDTLLQNGELTKVKAMVCNSPCRRELAFQWRVCQRFANLASDPMWDADSQEGAIAFLGEIYFNDAVWGSDAKVKQCIIDILMQLASTSSTSGGAKQAVQRLLQEFANDDDQRKRALYDACQKEGSTSHLSKVALPVPSLSPLLDRVQERPAFEADLRRLARVRLEELGDAIYIAPEAKSHRQAPDENLFDLTTKANKFLDGNGKVLLIWGDSGAGKSTFNRELERELWNDYMECKDRILRRKKKIPIFIHLPAIYKPEPDLIGRELHKIGFSEAQIKDLKARRKFVLICDGYDEYHQRCNLYDLNQLNRRGQWKAQMVISCRSEYLGHDYRSVFQPENRYGQKGETLLQEAVIAPFSKDQIQAYIDKYVAKGSPQWEASDYLHVFEGIPSLQELVTNPFLLTLALRVLPNMVDLGKDLLLIKVTRVILYDQFVEQWIDQGESRIIKKGIFGNEKKAYDELSVDNFLHSAIQFVTSLAVAIFENQNGHPVVKYSRSQDKGTWKEDFFSQDDVKKLLCEACPIHRDGNWYWFTHKSILEYCLARAVFEPTNRENERCLASTQALPRRSSTEFVSSFENLVTLEASGVLKEQILLKSPLVRKSYVDEPSILKFLAERVLQEPYFKQQLYDYIEYSKVDEKWCTAAANAITILIKAEVRFNGADLRGIRIPGADLSGGQFDSAQLQGADLRNVSLRNIWLRQAKLDNAQMSGADFGEWPHLKEESYVFFCAYSPDGMTLAVSLHNKIINIYDTTGNWVKIHTLRGHTDSVETAIYSPSGHQIASGSSDRTVRLWDAHTGAPGHILRGHTDVVNSVAYSPSGYQIVSGSDDHTLRLWDAQTGMPGPILVGHDMAVKSVAYSPSGHRIVSGSEDKMLRLWDAQTGKPGPILSGHTDEVTSVTYSPSGDEIASGSCDKTVRLWDAQTGAHGPILEGHSSTVFKVAYSPSGRQIASASLDRTVRLWDAQSGAPGPILNGHNDWIRGVTFSPSGHQIASASWDEGVRLWDVQASTSGTIMHGNIGKVGSVAYSPTGHQIASGGEDQTVRLWDAQTGASGPILIGHTWDISSITYSPSGRQIASASWDETVRLWDAQTGAPGLILSGHTGYVTSVAYSPSGHQIASASWDQTVRLWDAQSGAAGLILSGHTDVVASVTYSPSGHQIASASWDETVRLWDAHTGASGPILSHSDGATSVTYSPSGSQIASACRDANVRLWDAQTGTLDRILDDHDSWINSVAYSPDGRQIVSGGDDSTVRLWDVDSGDCLIILEDREASSVAWNPAAALNGIYFAVGCGDFVRAWKIIEEEDGYQVRLLWSSKQDRPSVSNSSFLNAQGLSNIGIQLLKQYTPVKEMPIPWVTVKVSNALRVTAR